MWLLKVIPQSGQNGMLRFDNIAMDIPLLILLAIDNGSLLAQIICPEPQEKVEITFKLPSHTAFKSLSLGMPDIIY